MAEKKSAKVSKETKAKKTKTEEKETKAEKIKTEEEETKNKGWIFALIGGAVAIAVAAIVAIVLNLKPASQADVTAKLSYTKAFFITDNNKGTLWNADGKRLTEDEYAYTSSFVGGYAYVKKDGQSGIIRDDGKMSVEFGKYGSIDTRGGLYLAQDGNTKEYSLITGAGTVLATGNELKVFSATYTAGAAAVKTEGKIKIFNYAGRLIAETPEVDDASDPAMNASMDFGVMYYAGQNFVFDARDGRLIAYFKDDRYTFDEVSEDRKLILLENYKDNNKYKLVADGKVYDFDEYEYYTFTPLDQVIGYNTTSKIALFDNNFKRVTEISSYVELKDAYNYAVETENGVEIYRNGEKIKNFGEDSEISHSGYFYEDLYAIEDNGKAMFYTLDGTVAINHEYKIIKTLFDEFHHAVACDDDNTCYLIDNKGNRVSDFTAKTISFRNGGYSAKNADGKYAISNKDGKLVTGFDYKDTYYRSYAEPHNIWTGEKDSKSYDVIDVDSGKAIATDVNVQSFELNYFVAKNSEGKNVYYTYTGEVFYTES